MIRKESLQRRKMSEKLRKYARFSQNVLDSQWKIALLGSKSNPGDASESRISRPYTLEIFINKWIWRWFSVIFYQCINRTLGHLHFCCISVECYCCSFVRRCVIILIRIRATIGRGTKCIHRMKSHSSNDKTERKKNRHENDVRRSMLNEKSQVIKRNCLNLLNPFKWSGMAIHLFFSRGDSVSMRAYTTNHSIYMRYNLYGDIDAGSRLCIPFERPLIPLTRKFPRAKKNVYK